MDNKINSYGVIYTCITGKYDQLNDSKFIHPEWKYVCFTDDPTIKNKNNSSWTIRPIVFDRMDNVRNSRWHKLHPHVILPEYDRSIFMDGNINIISDGIFQDIDIAIKKNRKLSIGKHASRKCIYDELDACMKFEKDDPEIMKKQIDRIKKDGFPENYGLFENNIIYREHNDKDVIKIMNDWWWWIENYSRRDQLSLTYVLWKNNFQISPLSDIPYRKSKKISFWRSQQHITKEELIRQKKIFDTLFEKVKK
jgi:hypothetical protein